MEVSPALSAAMAELRLGSPQVFPDPESSLLTEAAPSWMQPGLFTEHRNTFFPEHRGN